ncbi:MAG: hypothetical protein QF795_05550 [Candidatus Marinimicrobia bacterium]|jgi:hypothetical protein|nr:hypothetical protein [Candidatus Neomarinimicrobiota bacterium]MDP7217234.1 hypothetical protein [Candidatus Neomarinimicrobiota bacterium]MDP7465769.1 hypothetical protein [Candidatus Neomarinimicrobiota bacterium]HJL75488.1 hypothetical protein [Candidatus Neomarinimicrobiota bacterium]|tara:strand:- start:158 stop:619 length:462 start_codon:yes stop_codon:yes gene_type:complete
MKKLIQLIGIAVIFCSLIFAGDAEDVKQSIENSFAYLNKMKKTLNDYSKDGALEFWSSGGLLQTIDPSGRPETYDEINITPKHIEVVVLAPGKAATAMYYSEGYMKLKGSAAVDHYLTRVSQTFVKEGGKWKTRTSHWSTVKGGYGTRQTGQE